MSSATGVVTTSDLEAVGVSAPDWIVTRLATDARLVASSGSNEELFLGIAPTSDVEHYLEGAAHHQVVSLTGSDSNYRRVAGTAVLESPLDQSFWVSSAIGSDQPSVKWPVASGEWTVVLMNADGSADVNAGVTAGAEIRFGMDGSVARRALRRTADGWRAPSAGLWGQRRVR